MAIEGFSWAKLRGSGHPQRAALSDSFRNRSNFGIGILYFAKADCPRGDAGDNGGGRHVRQQHGASTNDGTTANPNSRPDEGSRSNPAFCLNGDGGRNQRE
jgi:hypothetical protein